MSRRPVIDTSAPEVWEYIAFTGARGTDQFAVVQRKAKAFEDDPGWDFKIEVRETVLIEVQSAWRDR